MQLNKNHNRTPIFFLNGAQFLAAQNDNLFKLIVVFSLTALIGSKTETAIISTVGLLYVLPYLLFSSLAGLLADRWSKKKILVTLKSLEALTMLFAFIAFSIQKSWMIYSIVLLLSCLNTFLGPAKYGIIPELVSKNAIGKSNGLITGFTYIALISGSLLASFLTGFTKNNYSLIALFGLFFSFIGLLSAIKLPTTPDHNQKRALPLFFIKRIYQTLKTASELPHMLTSILSGAFFIFIGSFIQLNIIPYATEVLHLSQHKSGYIFLPVALGIGFGAFLAGRMLKKRITLGLSCFSGFFLSFLFCTIPLATSLSTTLPLLFVIGFVGGVFIVPFNSFIQLTAPEERRAEFISSENFVGFIGVLLSSFLLYFFSDKLALSPAIGFFIIGIFCFFIAILLSFILADHFVPFIATHFFKEKPLLNLALSQKIANPSFCLISKNGLDYLKLLAHFEDLPLTFTNKTLFKIKSPNSCLCVQNEKELENLPWTDNLVFIQTIYVDGKECFEITLPKKPE